MAVPRPSLQSQLGKGASELAQREGHPQGKTKLPTGCVPLKQLCSGLPFSRSTAAAKRWQKGGGEGWEQASSTPNYSWSGQWEKHWAKQPQTLPRDLKKIHFPFPNLQSSLRGPTPTMSHSSLGFQNLERTAPQNFSLAHLDSSSGNGTILSILSAGRTPRAERNHTGHWPQRWCEKHTKSPEVHEKDQVAMSILGFMSRS